MNAHVFNTWICVNLLHPLFMFFYLKDMNGLFQGETLYILVQILLFSLLLSLPALIASFFAVYGISKLPVSPILRLVTWTIAGTLIAVCNFSLYIGFSILLKDMDIAIPGMAATGVVILLRGHHFVKMLASLKNAERENNFDFENENV